MSWTIDYSKPTHPEMLDAFLLAVGKALCLANNFEAKCAHYLRVVAFTDALRAGTSTPDAIELAKRAHSQRLASVVKGIHASGDISDEEVILLDRARESRNFIAHEGADFGELFRAQPERVFRALARLYPHVLNVARGENLVSKWAYEVSEREPAPREFFEGYADMAMAWVFGSALSAVTKHVDDL